MVKSYLYVEFITFEAETFVLMFLGSLSVPARSDRLRQRHLMLFGYQAKMLVT